MKGSRHYQETVPNKQVIAIDIFSHYSDCSSRGKIVTVIVGPERRRYEVQLQQLGPLLWERLEESSRTIELPEEGHDARNIFVNWQHNRGRLPRVPDLGSYFPNAAKRRGQDKDELPFLPSYDRFVPCTSLWENFVFVSDVTKAKLQSPGIHFLRQPNHQIMQPSRQLRRVQHSAGKFHGGPVDTGHATIRKEPDAILPNIEPEEAVPPTCFSVPKAPFTSGPATKSATPHNEHHNAETSQSDSTVTATGSNKSAQNNIAAALSTIPLCIPEHVARKAETLQSTLLNLALMAEEYRLLPLVNAAINAFKHGELQLQRQHPSLEHDHAPVRGTENRAMGRYVELFATPGFARAMTDRFDGTIKVPGGCDLLDAGVRSYRY
ncbi:hypothetical protein DL766_003462 [Monosporascus sp. MC13-8B]|uniref:Uncharacterized protein n=1 Tax=Monosporascus cannonballus TaxID=155416 RepID=A0ABY0HA14_9PEZI|nr:hypothetical protein DL762_003799 [Monosporascus cannonballus]RYP33431.1 hypothetical protein DL766_003462 [Monosporascus sp. MC13-8B]